MISALKALITSVAAAAVVLFAAPYVAGAGYGLGGYIPYGVVCEKKDELFSGTIRAEDYQAFLMNRGCTYEKAIADIVSADDFAVPNGVVLDVLQGKRSAANASEVMAVGAVRAELRKFKWSKATSDCPVGEYCAMRYWWGNDIISHVFVGVLSAYMRYFSPTFSATIFTSSSSLIAFANGGPAYCALVFVGYTIFAALIGFVMSKALGYASGIGA